MEAAVLPLSLISQLSGICCMMDAAGVFMKPGTIDIF